MAPISRPLFSTTTLATFVLLLVTVQVGDVSPQLYTYLEDLAKIWDLPLFNIDPDNIDLDRNQGDVNDNIEKFRLVTCLAKVPAVATNSFHDGKWMMEWYDFFRSDHEGNFNPHYFCANVPNPRLKVDRDLKLQPDRPDKVSKDAGYRTPHSRFWLGEPTAWNWFPRWSMSGLSMGEVIHMAKHNENDNYPTGYIFRVDVTGIKSRGRFLKGWFHLKITLDVDHNVFTLNATSPVPVIDRKRVAEVLNNSVVDKLMVTARGRMATSGKPRAINVQGIIRRSWVGGIGQFVQDFPNCAETGYTQEYVTQQFMPCGVVQYGEAVYGNNFYYTRTADNFTRTKYGKTHLNKDGLTEIHLNYRLDNSFSNHYYDLDFVVNGIVAKANIWDNPPYPPYPKHADKIFSKSRAFRKLTMEVSQRMFSEFEGN
ncbi:uncharacterized protein LOC118435312 isoform X1 [Folsomia candida]|uniref:uncharacterized protein LOC118435312 isoform X1 n=1 Tax=Folsomia candida TaxID=158441 RepID=UPI001604BBA3|nr:uncharacterized protein LOC118435312 isoform X1 [Folsomia candida]